MRQANRRIRLLIAVFALIFVAAFGRVAWLQAVKAQALDRIATSQHREERDGARAPRDDLRPAREAARLR